MPYCPQCGNETQPEAAFCVDCGARLSARLNEQAPASPPEQQPSTPQQQPPTPRPAAKGGATPWSNLGVLAVLGGAVLGLVAVYDAAANDGDWADSIFGGGGGEEASVVVPSPTPEATAQPSPPVEPTPTKEPSPEPTATPIPEIYYTPEEAIGAFLADYGLPYVGDCEDANLDTDIGYYCSLLWEDQFDTRYYVAGPTFSEPDMWLLLARLSAGDDWTVLDTADFVPGPQDTVPPWQ